MIGSINFAMVYLYCIDVILHIHKSIIILEFEYFISYCLIIPYYFSSYLHVLQKMHNEAVLRKREIYHQTIHSTISTAINSVRTFNTLTAEVDTIQS